MKRLALLTIPLLFAFTVFGSTAAFAAESDTIYPDDEDFKQPLTFTSLSDYAVDGEIYAFAEGKTVSVWNDGSRIEYTFDNRIVKLDCAEGVFYCADNAENVFSLPDKKNAEHEFQTAQSSITIDKFTYSLIDGTLKVADFRDGVEKIETLGEFSNLKQYDGCVYAIKGNELYKFRETTSSKVSLVYDDYSATQNILVGQAAEQLQVYHELTFVTVKNGAHMTQIDLTMHDGKYGEYFDSGKTLIAEGDDDDPVVALLLCKTGNAAIIAIKNTAYIVSENNITPTDIDCYTQKEFSEATVTGDRIYCTPFFIGDKKESEDYSPRNDSGTIIKVLNKIEYGQVLGSVYYEVSYENEDGEEIKGYVAYGFLKEYIIEDNKEPTSYTPEYSEENNVRTVLLVLAVVILVLAAVGYITYVMTGNKRKAKASNAEKKQKEDKQNNSDK